MNTVLLEAVFQLKMTKLAINSQLFSANPNLLNSVPLKNYLSRGNRGGTQGEKRENDMLHDTLHGIWMNLDDDFGSNLENANIPF